MVFGLTHDLNGTHRDSRSAEEQRLHLLMYLFLCCSLGVAREGVASVIDHDIEMEVLAEVLRSSGEGGVDRIDRGHVHGKLEDVGVCIREVREAGRVASRGNQALVWLARDQVGNLATYARRATGNFFKIRDLVICCMSA